MSKDAEIDRAFVNAERDSEKTKQSRSFADLLYGDAAARVWVRGDEKFKSHVYATRKAALEVAKATCAEDWVCVPVRGAPQAAALPDPDCETCETRIEYEGLHEKIRNQRTACQTYKDDGAKWFDRCRTREFLRGVMQADLDVANKRIRELEKRGAGCREKGCNCDECRCLALQGDVCDLELEVEGLKKQLANAHRNLEYMRSMATAYGLDYSKSVKEAGADLAYLEAERDSANVRVAAFERQASFTKSARADDAQQLREGIEHISKSYYASMQYLKTALRTLLREAP